MSSYHTSLQRLEQWLTHNGWVGFDPYDVKGSDLYLTFQKFPIIRYPLSNSVEFFPRLTRTLFRIQPAYNAKAMALFARGYLNLYRSMAEEKFLEKAKYCLNWLINNPSPGYSGYCWGYPFDWQSVIFIPKGTPSSVVTSQAAHAFIDAYEITHNQEYLDIACSCCSFFLHDLKRDNVTPESLCFSYTPIDTYHVHNANLWTASVLIRIGSNISNPDLKETALKAYRYTINHQNNDGSWIYWGPPDSYNRVIDNYHTGFVLECLNIARRNLRNQWEWDTPLLKGLDYYKKHLFLEDGTPRLRNDATYPIDIHSCAQAIITFAEFADVDLELKDLLEKVVNWSIANMQDQSGYFYYRKYKNRIDRMPYIRWGQAWMLRAMSCLCMSNLNEKAL